MRRLISNHYVLSISYSVLHLSGWAVCLCRVSDQCLPFMHMGEGAVTCYTKPLEDSAQIGYDVIKLCAHTSYNDRSNDSAFPVKRLKMAQIG